MSFVRRCYDEIEMQYNVLRKKTFEWVTDNYIWLQELGKACPLLKLYMWDLMFTVQNASMKKGPGHDVNP